jgi:hypothetical protein
MLNRISQRIKIVSNIIKTMGDSPKKLKKANNYASNMARKLKMSKVYRTLLQDKLRMRQLLGYRTNSTLLQ